MPRAAWSVVTSSIPYTQATGGTFPGGSETGGPTSDSGVDHSEKLSDSIRDSTGLDLSPRRSPLKRPVMVPRAVVDSPFGVTSLGPASRCSGSGPLASKPDARDMAAAVGRGSRRRRPQGGERVQVSRPHASCMRGRNGQDSEKDPADRFLFRDSATSSTCTFVASVVAISLPKGDGHRR